MEDFDIIKLNNEFCIALVIMKTSDSPIVYLNEIEEQLGGLNNSGKVLIDGLLHSGNTNERFISVFFDGNTFDIKSFGFEKLDRRSEIRSYICEYLKSDHELLRYGCLSEKQQKLIMSGCFI